MLKFRNGEKNNALSAKSVAVLVIKIMLDALSRTLIFGIWMYVYNNGQFSTDLTVKTYYSAVMILLLFNLFFSWNKSFIGKISNIHQL